MRHGRQGKHTHAGPSLAREAERHAIRSSPSYNRGWRFVRFDGITLNAMTKRRVQRWSVVAVSYLAFSIGLWGSLGAVGLPRQARQTRGSSAAAARPVRLSRAGAEQDAKASSEAVGSSSKAGAGNEVVVESSSKAGGLDPSASEARLTALKAAVPGRIVGLSIRGSLDRQVAALRKAAAGLTSQDLLILEIRSSGGAVRSARTMTDLLLRGPFHTVAFVDGRALGNAAVVAMACEVVAVTPRSRFGAAEVDQFQAGDQKGPVALFESVARKRHRNVAVAAAMADPERTVALDEAVKKGLQGDEAEGLIGAAKGHYLRLGSQAARRLHMADLTTDGLSALRRMLGLGRRDLLLDGKVFAALDSGSSDLRRLRRPKAVDPKKLFAHVTKVYVVPIHGTIDMGLAPFVKRVLDGRTERDVVILDVDTFGGRVDAAVQIRDALLGTKAKTIAFVNRRAISAGSLISMACDLIVMTPGGSMGAATPIQISGGKAKAVGEKVVSYMRKEMKSTAEAKGRRGDLAEAMVDRDVEIHDIDPKLAESISGLKKGKLLTMTTKEALILGMADMEQPSEQAMLRTFGIDQLPLVRPKVNWAEKVARFLTDPIVSGILMTLGMLGLLLELYTPGFGLSGIFGAICLALFFFGHMIANLAGWGHVLLFVGGLVLLGIEVFVTPGFGVLGLSGILLIVASLVLALAGAGGLGFKVAWHLGYISRALAIVMASVVVTALAGYFMTKYLPRSKFWGQMILQTNPVVLGGAAVSVDRTEGAAEALEIGATGRAVSLLRPAGKVRFATGTRSVMAEGDYVSKGTEVEVVRFEAGRPVVRPIRREV